MNPRKSGATLRDVARKAGVSYQTVSRAINDHRDISATTRERVLQVAQAMGYRPNRMAGSLRTRRSNVIGVVVSDVGNLFYAQVLSGIEDRARASGYSVTLANSAESVAREQEAVQILLEQRADGIILAPSGGSHGYLQGLLPDRFPIVAINRKPSPFLCCAVLTENTRAMRAATEFLIDRGHRKLGAVAGAHELMTARERLAGFKAALKGRGLKPNAEWIGEAGFRPDSGRAAARAILSRPDRPSALVGCTNMITEGILLALNDLGLRRGVDIDVVGCDLPYAGLLDPPLPVVIQPTYRMGHAAVELLFDLIENGAARHKVLRLPAQFTPAENAGHLLQREAPPLRGRPSDR